MIPKSEPQPFAGRKQPRSSEVILIIPLLGGHLTCSNEWRINSEVARHFGGIWKAFELVFPPLSPLSAPLYLWSPWINLAMATLWLHFLYFGDWWLFMAAILATGQRHQISSDSLRIPKNIPVTFFKSWNLKLFSRFSMICTSLKKG